MKILLKEAKPDPREKYHKLAREFSLFLVQHPQYRSQFAKLFSNPQDIEEVLSRGEEASLNDLLLIKRLKDFYRADVDLIESIENLSITMSSDLDAVRDIISAISEVFVLELVKKKFPGNVTVCECTIEIIDGKNSWSSPGLLDVVTCDEQPKGLCYECKSSKHSKREQIKVLYVISEKSGRNIEVACFTFARSSAFIKNLQGLRLPSNWRDTLKVVGRETLNRFDGYPE